jgi:hypothetical protein
LPFSLSSPAEVSLCSARFDAAANEYESLLSAVACAAPAAGADICAAESLAVRLSDAEAVLVLADVASLLDEELANAEEFVDEDGFYSDDEPLPALPALPLDWPPFASHEDFYSHEPPDAPERNAPLRSMRRDGKGS